MRANAQRDLTIVLLALLSALLLALAGCSKTEAPPEPVRYVRTMTVAPASAGGVHEYAGDVRARVESRLGFRVGGKIARRPVELGDAVRAGQVLAQLDPQDLKLGQDNARAALYAAQANHDLAEADFRRYQALLSQGFISAAELERREATLKAARATLEQARSQVAVQVNQTGYANLLADAAGVVTAIDAEPGQVVSAGAAVVRLAHDGPRDVVFAVPEDQQDWLRRLEGRPGGVRVRLWGSDETFAATVREIAAATDATTRTFLVKADIGRAPAKLGQTATALIDTPRADGVIKLPLSALFESGGRSQVWVLDPSSMTLKMQPVEVAGADGNLAVIVQGLRGGEEVVTAGVHVLTAGLTVRRYIEPKPSEPKPIEPKPGEAKPLPSSSAVPTNASSAVSTAPARASR